MKPSSLPCRKKRCPVEQTMVSFTLALSLQAINIVSANSQKYSFKSFS